MPFDAPEWSTDWTFLGIEDTVATSRFLPQGVREGGDGFVVDSLGTSQAVLLGDVCEVCTCFTGPIPPVTITPSEWYLPLPPGLSAARIATGTARVVLVNELGFDLLRDGQGGEGFLSVQLVDRLTNEAVDSLRFSEPFPPGGSIDLSFDLAGLEVHRNMVARVQGFTPGSGCDTVPLAPESGILTDVVLEDVRAQDVTVIVSDAALVIEPEAIDLPGLVSDRLRPGDARLSLEVEMITSVPIEVEVLLSVAASPEALFTEKSGLFTPILVPPGSPEDPGTVRKTFLLDVEEIERAETLHIDSRNRVLGSRRVTVRGGERVAYRVWLHAELPSR